MAVAMPRPAPSSGSQVSSLVRAAAPDEQRRLQALAAHRQRPDDHQPPGRAVGGLVHLVLQVLVQRLGGLGHPEDHPGHQASGQDGQRAADDLLRLEGQPLRAEGQQRAETQRDRDRDAHAGVDARQQVPAVRFGQVRDQQDDDQDRFQSLAQSDQVVSDHLVLPS